MRAVKSRGNKATEIALMQILRRNEITGWRRHPLLIGSPDFGFREEKIAVFVDGCFWHGCPKHCRMPRGNRAYWDHKIAANRVRDQFVIRALRRLGWHVMRIWEHEISRTGEANVCRRLRRVLNRQSHHVVRRHGALRRTSPVRT